MEHKQFRVEVDPDIADLVPQFLENRNKDLLSLEELLASKNANDIAQLAHKIKGSAAGYGFTDLSRIAAEMEIAAKDSNFQVIEKLYKDACQYMAEVVVVYPR
jgi:HPt (histidine-containing phosphotransfer) domain-containing protein